MLNSIIEKTKKIGGNKEEKSNNSKLNKSLSENISNQIKRYQ